MDKAWKPEPKGDWYPVIGQYVASRADSSQRSAVLGGQHAS